VQVAPNAGQHAELAGQVDRVAQAGQQRIIDVGMDDDGGDDIADREQAAGQRPVHQAGLTRTGEVKEAHAGGHDRAGECGRHDECECIHPLPLRQATCQI
jgi:hypothetical protein